MYIKIINKSNKVYFVLCVCDCKTKVWVSRFIEEEVANYLMNAGVKVKNL